MVKKLTVSELSSILGVSVNTTWKKIHKKGLLTDKEVVNNREITVVLLGDDEYEELLSERGGVSLSSGGGNEPIYEDNVTMGEGDNLRGGIKSTRNDGVDLSAMMDKFFKYSLEVNNQMKEYTDRVINAEKQVKLLEDIEKRKDDEFSRLRAEVKELKALNEQLMSENAQLKVQLEKKNLFSFWKK